MNRIVHTLLAIFFFSTLITGCIEDSFSTSPSDQPEFSTDTLSLGTVFTDEPSATSMFVVHNRYSKGMNISSIAVTGTGASSFRINVDGISAKDFANVEIRAKDSIFVLVEATLPEVTGAEEKVFTADLNFITNGVTRKVVLKALGQNVSRLRSVTLEEDRTFTADRPYQIFDSLIVAQGVTLTLEAGTKMLFHDGAYMRVYGTLAGQGTPEAPVVLSGDRMGNVVGYISFDIMSKQWGGLAFAPTSTGNILKYTEIKNSTFGVVTDRAPLELINCHLRNSGGTVLAAEDAVIKAVGCEFAEAADGLVDLYGGTYVFNHCTFANNYLFAVISGPALDFNLGDDESAELHLDVSNSIIAGLGTAISGGDITYRDIHFRHCLFQSEGEDDANFIECIWGEDPLFYTIRNEYLFDYRLQPDSPAVGAADVTLTLEEALVDWYGNLRGDTPDIGAYALEQ